MLKDEDKENLGLYIANCKQSKLNIDTSIFSQYEKFGYESKDIFKIDLEFLILSYGVQITEHKKFRSGQEKFRDELINRDKTCVISANDYDECDAAHIVPLVKSNNYDIDNGLLLNKTLHDSFDKHYWCIDPHTLRVILNKSKLSDRKFSCTKYDNILVNIQPNKKMLKNLKKRYEMFIENV